MKLISKVFLFFTVSIFLADAYRILAIFPLKAISHHMMFDAIIKTLATKGHQIDVMTHFPLKKPVPNYKVVVNLGNAKANVTLDFKVAIDSNKQGTTFMTQFGNYKCEHLNNSDLQKIIKNPPKNPAYDLVITEAFASPCYLGIGWALKVPVVLASSCLDLPWLTDLLGQPTNTAYYPQFFTTYFHPLSFFERLHNTFKTYRDLALFRELTTDVQNNLMRKYIDPHIPSIEELEKNVALALVNSHHSLHGVRPLVPSLIEVGGLHIREHYKPLPSDLEKWMNESTAGIVYFSLGSIVNIETFPHNDIKAFYSAFSKLSPIRVLMKVVDKDKLPPGLPNNVKISPWFPQVAILEHKNTKAFITHCGLMGTQEALTLGVPMIGIPLFGDQPRNMDVYVRKNIAVKLGYTNLTENKIYNAIQEILYNPKYKLAIDYERIQFLDRPLSAENATIFWTEYAVRNGPHALPIIGMPWWKIHLLDIYTLLLMLIIISACLIFLILYALFKLFFSKKLKGCKLHKDL